MRGLSLTLVNQGLPDALRFCVVRETTNTYQVTVYDPLGRILRETSDVPVAEIMDKLGFELEQLQSRAVLLSNGERGIAT